MDDKHKYQEPQLTVVTFHVEKGFTATGPNPVVSSFNIFMEESPSTDNTKASSFQEDNWSW